MKTVKMRWQIWYPQTGTISRFRGGFGSVCAAVCVWCSTGFPANDTHCVMLTKLQYFSQLCSLGILISCKLNFCNKFSQRMWRWRFCQCFCLCVFSQEALSLLLASPHVTSLANEALLQLTARAEVLSLSYGCVHNLERISNQLR